MKVRRWLLPLGVGVAVFVIASAVASQNNSPDRDASVAKAGISTPSQATTSAPATAGIGAPDERDDVQIIACDTNTGNMFIDMRVVLQVKNNSSKRSNYLISVDVTSPDGSRSYGQAHSYPTLDPGQSTTDENAGLAVTIPDGASFICKLASVERTRAYS